MVSKFERSLLSSNPIDLKNIENNCTNNKTSIEVNLVKPRNAKCISDLEYKEKSAGTDLAYYEEIEEDADENNFDETKQFMNKTKLFKNRNNQGNHNKSKYKDIEDENITTDNSGGNEQIPINDENLIKDIKNEEFNDINYEDFEKRKSCEDFENVGQLNEETLFKNVDNKKRYYEDIEEDKSDRNDTEELLNEEYLLINDEDNDKDNAEKCCIELDIKDIKKGTVYGNKEKTIQQLDEENLFSIINKRLINVIINQIKNEGNENALYRLIKNENISETFISQVLRYVMDSIPILLENKNKRYAMQTRSQLKNSKNISNNNEDNIKNKLIRNVAVTNNVQKKRGRPRKIIQQVKLQEQIKKRGRPRKCINKSPEINKTRKFMESEDESDSDPDYDIKQKPKTWKIIKI